MHIVKLKVRDFKCYRGEHVLDLEPKVYAVTATLSTDVERSNWLGKSSLLEAIGYALYGRHHEGTEDSVITRGEKIAEVSLDLSDGTTITRRREHGKSTRLSVMLARGDGKGATQAEAQKIIEEKVGLSEADFIRTCFFEQKKMAELITMKPGPRMEVITEWLRLDPLERCEAELAEEIRKGVSVLDQYDKDLYACKTVIDDSKNIDEVRTKLEEINAQIADRKEALEEVRSLEAKAEAQRTIIRNAERFDELVEQGKKLKEEIDELEAPNKSDETIEQEASRLATEGQDLASKYDAAEETLKQRKVLARGKFDGKCPVAGIKCPARNEINANLEENTKRYEEARAFLDSIEETMEEHNEVLREVKMDLEHLVSKRANLKGIKERCVELQDDKKKSLKLKLIDTDEIRMRFNAVQGALLELTSEAERLRGTIKRYEQAIESSNEVIAERNKLAEQIALHREAMVIFGKNGAQRRVAEHALAVIEDGANGMLRQCGIPLDLSVQWAREGSGLATVCEACGNPFPASTKVRQCMRCNAERGPKMVNKLDIVLSDRSGAAEDLAGAALQLSASSWLRADRISGWGTALIDEPFGALDAANRKAFAAHLTSMLSTGHGFKQAFVIAHHASVLDALPGRIVIKSDGKHSVPKVVA